MRPALPRRAVIASTVVALLGVTALPAAAVSSSVAPTWSSSADGGLLADDFTQFVHAATNPDRDTTRPVTLNSGNYVYTAGTAYQPSGSPVRQDRDVLFSAFDAVTGETVWTSRYDCGTARASDTYISSLGADRGACQLPGTDEDLVAFDIDGNNNLGYATMNLGTGAVRFQKIALSSGQPVSGSFPGFEIQGARANDADHSWPGGNVVIAGTKGGNFWVTSREIGNPAVSFDLTSVPGEALDVDLVRTFTVDRSALVTGRASVNGGDIHTALFTWRGTGAGQRWARTWTGPNGGKDEGIAAEQGQLPGIGPVSFVAGRSFSTATGWDMVVLAYDNANGDLLWEQTWSNLPGQDDQPTDLRFNAATQSLVVVGTTERGTPQGQDVVVLAFDALTGAPRAQAFASGDISNGDDQPIALEISPDGSRVFVLAQAHNFLHTGGQVEALFAFDAGLRPAGTAVVSSEGTGQPLGGLAFTHGFQDTVDVVVGSRTRADLTGVDQQVQRLPMANFVVQTVATTLTFTGDTASTVVAGDTATVAAALVDATGSPIVAADVTLGFGPDTLTVTTDALGVARADFDTAGLRGTVALTADYAGDGVFLPSQAQSTAEVVRLATSLMFTEETATSVEAGEPATVTILLHDDEGAPVVDAAVTITLSDDTTQAATDATGRASVAFETSSLEPGTHDITAAFAGDDRHEPTSAATVLAVEVPEPGFFAAVSRSHKGVTVTVSASDVAAEEVDVAFDADYFADDRPGAGMGRREAVGVANLMLVVSELVDGVWVDIHTDQRAATHLFANHGSGDGPDWSLTFEAIDQSGTYRFELTGDLIDGDGEVLPGRAIKLNVDLG